MTTATRRGLPDLGELEIEHGLRAISHDLTKKFAGRPPRIPSTGSSASRSP